MRFLPLSFLLFCLCFSCGKEKITLSWTELSSNTTHDLNAISFEDDNKGYIVGGETWSYGIHLATTDGGETWQSDSITDKKVYGIDVTDGVKHVVGIEGRLHWQRNESEGWVFQGLSHGRDVLSMQAVDFFDEHNGVLGGGVAYQAGILVTLTDNYTVASVDTFLNEIAAVCYSDKNTIHAVGYGIILRSTDAGLTWELSDTKDDFYTDVYFVSTTTGYAVGAVGTILKTTDAGLTWEKLRNGDSIAVADKAFRAVHFVDEEKGYIVGDEGLFWKTTNGGDDWQVVKDFPDVDLNDIFVQNGTGFIVGEKGSIFKFSD